MAVSTTQTLPSAETAFAGAEEAYFAVVVMPGTHGRNERRYPWPATKIDKRFETATCAIGRSARRIGRRCE